jgi:hypothetical protein
MNADRFDLSAKSSGWTEQNTGAGSVAAPVTAD